MREKEKHPTNYICFQFENADKCHNYYKIQKNNMFYSLLKWKKTSFSSMFAYVCFKHIFI